MSVPVTTLKDIIELALKEYGIRFQVTPEQLVRFANMIQYIAFNQDVDAFISRKQVLVLGQDVFMQGDSTLPIDSDLGKTVNSIDQGPLGTLIGFDLTNKVQKWIIEPFPNTTISGIGGDVLIIPDGNITTNGEAVVTQNFDVSRGPYRVSEIEPDGDSKPFRKLIGITKVTDEQIFSVPSNDGVNGPDDYGLFLNQQPGRNQNIPLRYDMQAQTITLVTSTPPIIEQTDLAVGAADTTINTSQYRWFYYFNPPPITSIEDEAKVILPEEYRYEILYEGISLLANRATYGSEEGIRPMIQQLCKRFWEDMRDQYQQYGRGSDYISHGDNWDWYGLGQNAPWGNSGMNRGSRWYGSS